MRIELQRAIKMEKEAAEGFILKGDSFGLRLGMSDAIMEQVLLSTDDTDAGS